jgi:prolyl oligopeptidase
LKDGEKWRLLRAAKVKGLPADDFVSKQVWYESKDGTKVPMFIVRHKDTPLDGTAPGYQYGLFIVLLSLSD